MVWAKNINFISIVIGTWFSIARVADSTTSLADNNRPELSSMTPSWRERLCDSGGQVNETAIKFPKSRTPGLDYRNPTFAGCQQFEAVIISETPGSPKRF